MPIKSSSTCAASTMRGSSRRKRCDRCKPGGHLLRRGAGLPEGAPVLLGRRLHAQLRDHASGACKQLFNDGGFEILHIERAHRRSRPASSAICLPPRPSSSTFPASMRSRAIPAPKISLQDPQEPVRNPDLRRAKPKPASVMLASPRDHRGRSSRFSRWGSTWRESARAIGGDRAVRYLAARARCWSASIAR